MKLSLAALLGLSLISISCSHQAKVQATGAEQQATTVAVAKAVHRNLAHNITLTAEFRPFQEIEVMAKVSGYIKAINVDVGDRVKQGQLLAVLEMPEMTNDLTRAQAALERSRAEVSRARDELQRAQAAHDMSHLTYSRLDSVMKTRPGLVAQQEIDDAHSRDLQSEAQISAAKSALSVSDEQVHVAEAEQAHVKTMYEYTRVTAPFDGVITKRFANLGSMIQAGTASTTQAMPVVRLSQNSLLRLILPVPESQVPLIKIGKSLEVNVPTLHRTFPGKIARFSDNLQVSTRTMDTEVDVPNPGLVIVPGMYAEVTFPLEESMDAIAIPLQAIAGPETKRTVYLVDASGKIEERPVEVGIETSDSAEIKSGLNAGDMVVIGGRSQLKPGQQVIPKMVDMQAGG